MTAISILIPQIEHILRRFYASLGYSITSNDMIGTMSDALGTLLNNDDIVIFDKDIKNCGIYSYPASESSQ